MARAASPKVKFEEGEVKEGVYIPELREIMYEYGRPVTVEYLLERALEYLKVAYPKDLVLSVIMYTIQERIKIINIAYDEKECEECGGRKGCFTLTVKRPPATFKACSVARALKIIQEQSSGGYEADDEYTIESIRLKSPAVDTADYMYKLERTEDEDTGEVGYKELNALDTGYFIPYFEDPPKPLPEKF